VLDVEGCAAGLANPASHGGEENDERENEGGEGFSKHVLNPPSDRLLSLCAGEGSNISHGCLCEVKEILKESGDDCLENNDAVVAAVPAANPENSQATRLPRQSMEGGALRRLLNR
jgi:hypothetical protein